MMQVGYLKKLIPLTIIRPAQGEWVRGRWVRGSRANAAEIAIEVSIQPLRGHELQLMPEAERSREWYKVYSSFEMRSLKEGVGGWPADEFEYEGKRFRITRTHTYKMGVLNHTKAWAARVPLTAGEADG